MAGRKRLFRYTDPSGDTGYFPGFAEIAARLGLTVTAVTRDFLIGIGALAYRVESFTEDTVLVERNFYGVLRVKEYGTEGGEDHLRRVLHAAQHGAEAAIHVGNCIRLTRCGWLR